MRAQEKEEIEQAVINKLCEKGLTPQSAPEDIAHAFINCASPKKCYQIAMDIRSRCAVTRCHQHTLSILPDGWFTLKDVKGAVEPRLVWELEDKGMLEAIREPDVIGVDRRYRKPTKADK